MLHTEGCDLSDAEHSGRLISCYSMVNFCEQFLTMAILFSVNFFTCFEWYPLKVYVDGFYLLTFRYISSKIGKRGETGEKKQCLNAGDK